MEYSINCPRVFLLDCDFFPNCWPMSKILPLTDKMAVIESLLVSHQAFSFNNADQRVCTTDALHGSSVNAMALFDVLVTGFLV